MIHEASSHRRLCYGDKTYIQPQSHTPCTFVFIIIHLTQTKFAFYWITHTYSDQDLSLIQQRLFWRLPQHDAHVAFQ